MSLNSLLGTQLGFPLGGSTSPPATPITRSVSDSYTLSDSIIEDPNDVSRNSFTDSITLSDSVAFTLYIVGQVLVSVSDTIQLSDSVIAAFFSTGPATAGVTQVLIEVAPHLEQGHNPPNIIDTQNAIEYLFHPSNNILGTQDLIEWLFHPPDNILATQILIEVCHKPYPAVPVKAHYKRFYPIKK
jgi:hypothetical protein